MYLTSIDQRLRKEQLSIAIKHHQFRDACLITHFFFFYDFRCEITQTQVSVTSGDIREGASQSVNVDVTLNSDGAAGSVSGSDLWRITPFLSSRSDASGSVQNFPNAVLSTFQGNAPLIAGSPTIISGVSIPVDLTSGPKCSQFRFFCVSVERNSLANPRFPP